MGNLTKKATVFLAGKKPANLQPPIDVLRNIRYHIFNASEKQHKILYMSFVALAPVRGPFSADRTEGSKK
jgi:hypothetical protein